MVDSLGRCPHQVTECPEKQSKLVDREVGEVWNPSHQNILSLLEQRRSLDLTLRLGNPDTF